ncbi:UDP-N-acetylmuramate dehydrogenase [Alcanivorax sp. 1008]|uniref:UDP-N-acetylmuramate dehydrogenase n=1 Tax=Alcanivorax sp. 1008 TaxID=2816853 RepID=UPI001DAB1477|nr:UDP-N-acetylmuramate dehydrogenase [Alcanivorax sp. 1008]MCC1496309.1 UDP-N-acetylmuramate dehydrogenase [Alcanivorax sp. 1008]
MTLRGHAALVNTLGLPASAQWYAALDDIAQLPALLANPSVTNLPLTVLGEGSNVVLRAELPGLVLRPQMRGMRIVEWRGSQALIECQAGESWDALVQWSLKQGLAGLENLSLIPGSVGAAPVQNIGAYGVELADRFDSLIACSLQNGKPRSFSPQECAFAYRDSFFKSVEPGAWMISSVRLLLDRDLAPVLGYADLASRYQALPDEQRNATGLRELVCSLRRSKLPDPALLPNAGSFFKNPVVPAEQYTSLQLRYPDLAAYPQADGSYKLAAGWLIERAGWKGKRVGNVGMHAQQALVLVNYAEATGAEVLAFADLVRQSVAEMFDVVLEQEPIILP